MLLANTLEFVILHDLNASWKAKWKEAKRTRLPNSKARFSHALGITKLVSFALLLTDTVTRVFEWYSSSVIAGPKTI